MAKTTTKKEMKKAALSYPSIPYHSPEYLEFERLAEKLRNLI